jgi:N-acetylglucosamine malate deacetylase 1
MRRNSGPLLVVAAHPDDETLGAGGYLLRRKAEGRALHWLIVTDPVDLPGWDAVAVARREAEIAAVAAAYGFTAVHRLRLPAAGLDRLPLADLHRGLAQIFAAVRPEEVLLPFYGDPHSDHRLVSDAGWACCKSFRAPYVRRVMMYECPSETEYARPPISFRPDVLVDVGPYVKRKWEILTLYAGEVGRHPFPRSEDAVTARVLVHGATAGCAAAEAFMLARELDLISSAEGAP